MTDPSVVPSVPFPAYVMTAEDKYVRRENQKKMKRKKPTEICVHVDQTNSMVVRISYENVSLTVIANIRGIVKASNTGGTILKSLSAIRCSGYKRNGFWKETIFLETRSFLS